MYIYIYTHTYTHTYIHTYIPTYIYRVFQGESVISRQNVAKGKLLRCNLKYLCPKLKVTEILTQQKCGLLAVPNTGSVSRDALSVHCARFSFSIIVFYFAQMLIML